MRRNISNMIISAAVTAFSLVPRTNLGVVVIRGWIVPPQIPFIS